MSQENKLQLLAPAEYKCDECGVEFRSNRSYNHIRHVKEAHPWIPPAQRNKIVRVSYPKSRAPWYYRILLPYYFRCD